MRWLLFTAAAVALSGCAIPPIVSVASLALDFASYGATGKTVADHGLSAVLRKDCSLFRGLEGEVCVAEGSAEAAVKPPREAETRGSLRFALLEEESNRAMVHQSAGSDARVTLQSTFATDPSITANPVPVPVQARATRVRRQVSGAAYLSSGYLSPGYLSPGYLSPGYLSQGIVPGHYFPAERETNG